MPNRRKFLLKSGLYGFVGFTAYSTWRGFRYPPLMFTLADESPEQQVGNLTVLTNDAIVVKKDGPLKNLSADFKLRAYGPEPKIVLRPEQSGNLSLLVNNVHKESDVSVSGAQLLDHRIDKTNHFLSLKLEKAQEVTLEFTFRRPDDYRFAAIGDTGGDKELDWCLQRMAQSGADFLLHLGDFVYQEGDYQRALDYFCHSEVPCYVSIGNHDFHHKGKIFQPYLDYIGVFSHAFQLGEVRFLNVDSANDFFPPWAGQRGRLLEALAESNQTDQQEQGVRETIAFTHRPLKDFRDGEDHDINGVHEAKWLHKKLLEAGTTHFFAGHVHDRHELDHEGLLQIIAGQGLAHQDLLLHKPVSEFVLGQVTTGQAVSYTWQPLLMPVSWHCNSVHLRYLRNSKHLKVLQDSGQFCPALVEKV